MSGLLTTFEFFNKEKYKRAYFVIKYIYGTQIVEPCDPATANFFMYYNIHLTPPESIPEVIKKENQHDTIHKNQKGQNFLHCLFSEDIFDGGIKPSDTGYHTTYHRISSHEQYTLLIKPTETIGDIDAKIHITQSMLSSDAPFNPSNEIRAILKAILDEKDGISDAKLVKLLIDRDNNNQTPLEILFRHDNKECIKILLARIKKLKDEEKLAILLTKNKDKNNLLHILFQSIYKEGEISKLLSQLSDTFGEETLKKALCAKNNNDEAAHRYLWAQLETEIAKKIFEINCHFPTVIDMMNEFIDCPIVDSDVIRLLIEDIIAMKYLHSTINQYTSQQEKNSGVDINKKINALCRILAKKYTKSSQETKQETKQETDYSLMEQVFLDTNEKGQNIICLLCCSLTQTNNWTSTHNESELLGHLKHFLSSLKKEHLIKALTQEDTDDYSAIHYVFDSNNQRIFYIIKPYIAPEKIFEATINTNRGRVILRKDTGNIKLLKQKIHIKSMITYLSVLKLDKNQKIKTHYIKFLKLLFSGVELSEESCNLNEFNSQEKDEDSYSRSIKNIIANKPDGVLLKRFKTFLQQEANSNAIAKEFWDGIKDCILTKPEIKEATPSDMQNFQKLSAYYWQCVSLPVPTDKSLIPKYRELLQSYEELVLCAYFKGKKPIAPIPNIRENDLLKEYVECYEKVADHLPSPVQLKTFIDVLIARRPVIKGGTTWKDCAPTEAPQPILPNPIRASLIGVASGNPAVSQQSAVAMRESTDQLKTSSSTSEDAKSDTSMTTSSANQSETLVAEQVSIPPLVKR